MLASAGTNAATMATAVVTGNVEQSSISIRFSDRVGDGSSSTYSFHITDGEGHVYGSVTNTELFETRDNAAIQSSILTALTSGIGTLDDTDSSIDINEFGVTFSGDQLISLTQRAEHLRLKNIVVLTVS